MWNVDKITLDGMGHTKDYCEGGNNSFRQTLGHDHPSMWRLIDHLRDDAALAITHLLKLPVDTRPRKDRENVQGVLENIFELMCIEVKPNNPNCGVFEWHWAEHLTEMTLLFCNRNV